MRHFSPSLGQEFNFLSTKVPDWQGWLATLVIDSTGRYVGGDGTSKSVANQTDLQLLLALRAKAEVIVTTGATARAESYKASRFAPIAVITRDKESLAHLPLIEEPGAHETIFLSSNLQGRGAQNDFSRTLKSMGFTRFLFEGGPSMLAELFKAEAPVLLVLSIANLSPSEMSVLSNAALRNLLLKVLPTNNLVLCEVYSVGQNVVSIWSS